MHFYTVLVVSSKQLKIPLTLFVAFTSAPYDINISTACVLPSNAAVCSGVSPS